MSTCKDCLHYDVCKKLSGYTEEFITSCEKNYEKYGDAKEKCEHFKDRSKFVELPCAIGDIVWSISQTGKIYEYTVNGVHQYENKDFMFGAYRIREDGKNIIHLWKDSEIGKTVFLTKQEAEQALEERSDK